MIYSVRIGEIEASIDDELTEERPTPEVVADYLTRVAQTAVGTWVAIPENIAEGG